MKKTESKYFNTAEKMDLALISLLKIKPLEYITVSEICKTADVNRSTFYLHYETIGDLLDETARYIIEDFLSYFPFDTVNTVNSLKDCSLDELVYISDKYLTPYLTYIYERRDVFSTVMSHSKTFDFENIFRKMFEHIFDPILQRFNYPESYRTYVILYYLNGITAIVQSWLKNGCKETVNEIIQIIEICIYGLNTYK